VRASHADTPGSGGRPQALWARAHGARRRGGRARHRRCGGAKRGRCAGSTGIKARAHHARLLADGDAGVAAGERDAVDERVRGEVVTDLAALARHVAHHARRQARLGEALHHVRGGRRALRRRLEHHRVARHQRRRDLGDGQVDAARAAARLRGRVTPSGPFRRAVGVRLGHAAGRPPRAAVRASASLLIRDAGQERARGRATASAWEEGARGAGGGRARVVEGRDAEHDAQRHLLRQAQLAALLARERVGEQQLALAQPAHALLRRVARQVARADDLRQRVLGALGHLAPVAQIRL